jgi:hypothetical protein
MNRHERRRARKISRENRFFSDYVSHLPRVANSAPFEPGTVNYMTVFHDSWCSIYDGAECDCNPIVERRIDPVRS